MISAVEANADGLIGPTHSYAGLSPGNLASSLNKGEASNPRAAVLQGLGKMKTLVGLGLPLTLKPDGVTLHIQGPYGTHALTLKGGVREVLATALLASAAAPGIGALLARHPGLALMAIRRFL